MPLDAPHWTGPSGPRGLQGPKGDKGDRGADGASASPLEAWPVGSVFIGAVSTSPATLLGGGTWQQIAGGRVLVGQTSGDVDFDTALETGGAKTVTLDVTQIPSHTHMQRRHGTTTGALSGVTTAPDTSSSNPADLGPVTGATGGGQAHNNMPPYLVVYIWERTA